MNSRNKNLYRFTTFTFAVVMMANAQSTMATDASNLLPEGFEVVNYSGGWRRGGSDPTKECLTHLQRNHPGGRFQILNKGEEGRWTGWHGRDREYRYWCTALVQKR